MVTENAELIQQLVMKKAELTMAEETISREQQQNRIMRQQVGHIIANVWSQSVLVHSVYIDYISDHN